MKKRILSVMALALVAAMCLVACGTPPTVSAPSSSAAPAASAAGDASAPADTPAPAADAITLRIGHVVADGTNIDRGLDHFAELVAQKSNGGIVVEIYPNSALGGNREMCEQLQMGTLDMAAPSTAFLSAFTDKTALFDLPYLFKSEKAAWEVMDGEIGQQINADLLPAGFVNLGWLTQSWRHVTCNNEVHKPADMKGLKIRVMDSPMHIAHFNALGASAVPMAFSEVYTALQQKTIDAQENPYSNIKMSRFDEVQKYIIETGHIYDPCPFLMSEKTWEKLSADQQAILSECAKEAIDWERQIAIEMDEEIKAEILTGGKTQIVELTDEERAEFRAAAQPVYDEFGPKIGEDVIAKVEEINAKY